MHPLGPCGEMRLDGLGLKLVAIVGVGLLAPFSKLHERDCASEEGNEDTAAHESQQFAPDPLLFAGTRDESAQQAQRSRPEDPGHCGWGSPERRNVDDSDHNQNHRYHCVDAEHPRGWHGWVSSFGP